MKKCELIDLIMAKCSDNMKEIIRLLQSMHVQDNKGDKILLTVISKTLLVQAEVDSLKDLQSQLCKCNSYEEMEVIFKSKDLLLPVDKLW